MARIFSRYIWLIDTIESHPDITFEEVSRKWEHSSLNDHQGEPLAERTFHRHRQEILNEFGINIACHKATNSYYIGDPEESKQSEVKQWLLKTISEENVISDGASLGDRIQVEEIPNGQKHLGAIITAMKEGVELDLTYQTFWNEESYTTTLKPFFVKAFERRWYVIGISGRHPGELRTYALDRVIEISISDRKFVYPKDFDPKAYYYNFYGIFHTSDKPERIVIKATNNQQKFLRTLPLHHSQKEIETGEDYAIFEYYLVPTLDFVQEIASRTDSIMVLEPEPLRNLLQKLFANLIECYR